MTNRNLLKKFKEYDKDKPQAVKEISGLLGIPINGRLTVEVPNRNSFVYVRLRNNTNELIQAFNEKVSPVYGLPVLVVWKTNRYEVQGRDTTRYQDWGSYSAFLPRHGSQHSLNFEDGQGGDVSFVYSRQFMPFATIPSGTDGAGTVFVMPHVYRAPDASWNYIGDESSSNFLPAKPTGTSARMMLLVWNLSTSDPLIITGTFLAESSTGTSSVLSSVPTVTNQSYIPLAAIRLVSGTETILWDNIYDMRQYAVTTPPPFAGGFAVWDEGVPVGTGTTLDFVGNNIQASVSGSVIRVYVTGSAGGGTTFAGVDQIGIFGQDEGINQGTGTVLNVTGQRATFTRSGTVLNLNISPDPQEIIGIYAQDEGVNIGTGTILNFVGNNVDVSLSGTVLRVFITGSTGGGTSFAGVDQIGIYALNNGSPIGTGTWMDFGDNISATRSGTVLRLNAVAAAPVQTDGFLVQDEGVLLGTGTILNFVGANVQATISGSVVQVMITGSSGGSSNYSPDRSPASPNASNDEFDDDSIAVAWSSIGTPDTISESTYHGFLYVQDNDSTACGLRKLYSPGSGTAFVAVVKTTINLPSSFGNLALAVETSVPGNIALIGIQNDTAGKIRYRSRNDASETNPLAVGTSYAGQYYLMLSRDASNTYTLKHSVDGIVWFTISSFSNSANVANVSVLMDSQGGGSTNSSFTMDFIRFFTSETEVIGS